MSHPPNPGAPMDYETHREMHPYPHSLPHWPVGVPVAVTGLVDTSGKAKLVIGEGAARRDSEARSLTYGILPCTERYIGLPFPFGGDKIGRLDHGGHQNDQPISTHLFPMLITSGVFGRM